MGNVPPCARVAWRDYAASHTRKQHNLCAKRANKTCAKTAHDVFSLRACECPFLFVGRARAHSLWFKQMLILFLVIYRRMKRAVASHAHRWDTPRSAHTRHDKQTLRRACFWGMGGYGWVWKVHTSVSHECDRIRGPHSTNKVITTPRAHEDALRSSSEPEIRLAKNRSLRWHTRKQPFLIRTQIYFTLYARAQLIILYRIYTHTHISRFGVFASLALSHNNLS